jgi:hypothetical protein
MEERLRSWSAAIFAALDGPKTPDYSHKPVRYHRENHHRALRLTRLGAT